MFRNVFYWKRKEPSQQCHSSSVYWHIVFQFWVLGRVVFLLIFIFQLLKRRRQWLHFMYLIWCMIALFSNQFYFIISSLLWHMSVCARLRWRVHVNILYILHAFYFLYTNRHTLTVRFVQFIHSSVYLFVCLLVVCLSVSPKKMCVCMKCSSHISEWLIGIQMSVRTMICG